MIVYLDANCLVMMVLEDAGHDVLRRWLASKELDPTSSDFGMGELVSAVSLRVRRGMIDADQGHAIVLNAAAFTAGWPNCRVDGTDIADATSLVAHFDLKLRLPDAIHIAVARRLGATLAASDQRQADAAVVLGLPVFNPLVGAAS